MKRDRGLLAAAAPPGSARRAGKIDQQIGDRLRSARLAAGLSLEDLAARIEVSCQQIYKYECGANRLSVSRLMQICDALGIECETVLRSDREAGVPVSGNAELDRLISVFSSLDNPGSRAKIIELATFLASFETKLE